MSEPIIYIDRSRIREGQLEALKPAMAELAEFVETHEPQLISYGFFIDEDAEQMTVVAIHPDAASMEFHMEIGGARFRAFAELISLESIEVYGEPSAKAREQLQAKARALGNGDELSVHTQQAGFTRVEVHRQTA